MQEQNISKENQELFAKATLALQQASIEARKVAMRTNTPLVIYTPEHGIQEVTITEISEDIIPMQSTGSF